MSKCPRCVERKAKRSCPALRQEICATCCAEGRLVTIQCPTTCPHLQGEHYQHARRREKAATRGKELVDTTRKLFPDDPAFEFAFALHADIYWFFRKGPQRGSTSDDASIAAAIDGARNAFLKILVAQAAAHPLATFLEERLRDARRYPSHPSLPAETRARILRELSRHVASLGGGRSQAYLELLGRFFDALDFETDLDYSPLDAPPGGGGRQPPEERRSAGGLILPP